MYVLDLTVEYWGSSLGHVSIANFALITNAWALQSDWNEAENYREQPSIL